MRAASDAARTYNFTTAGAWSGTVDAQGGSTAYVRDADRALLRVTDPLGRTTSFVYDANRNVIAITNALGQATTFAFDAVGNRTSQTDPAGMTTQWTYDSLNHVTSVSSGTLTYEYDYNAASQRTAMRTKVNGVTTETTTYEYDDRGRLIRKTDPSGYVLTYAYDAVGNRTSLIVGQAASPAVLNISYTYDTRNRVSSITGNGKTTSFSYDAAGRRVAAFWPNDTTASYSYNDANELLSLTHSVVGQAPPLAAFAYTYDLSGNRTSMTTLEGVNAYTYDARNWLTSATYPDGRTEQFEYDPVGNRTKRTDSVHGVTTYSYGAGNRLLSDSNGTYSYDNAGRLIAQTLNGQSRSYQYSFRGQMTSLTDTNGTTFTYDFDGDGNRAKASTSGCLTSRYVYDGPNAILELNASNQVLNAYVQGPGIDQMIERIGFINGEARKREVYHTDGLGSVVAATDETQNLVKTYTYEAFGKIRAESGSTIDRYTFTSRESLGDSLGFCFYRWRVYDPNVGRFTSEDPLGFRDGPNLYGYVGNNPVNYTDPEGLWKPNPWRRLPPATQLGDPEWCGLIFEGKRTCKYRCGNGMVVVEPKGECESCPDEYWLSPSDPRFKDWGRGR
jgi:RHS repeat-associated protein